MSVMEYRDATSLVGAPTSSIYPTKDKEGNVLETEYGLSVYKVRCAVELGDVERRKPQSYSPGFCYARRC